MASSRTFTGSPAALPAGAATVKRRVFRALAALAVVLSACAWGASATARTPARFSPVSFTADSANEYWVLGRVSCRAGRCFSILHTTDGGRTFDRLPAPALPAEGLVPALRFTDRHNGFAFVPGIRGVLYVTHDGAASWRRASLRGVLALATGGGNAYAVTARCGLQRCARYRFERSPASSDVWRATALPFTPDGAVVDLTARGSRVWLLGTPAGAARSRSDLLARSVDSGRSFVTGAGPCFPGLGGALSPVSATVVWAVCPTGMMAGASRSTDGGITFRTVRTPPLANSAVLAPASRASAVLARNGARSPLLRTADGGVTWKVARTPGPAVDVDWIGFTDARAGAALVQTPFDASLQAGSQSLWRTSDGGAHWSPVPLR